MRINWGWVRRITSLLVLLALILAGPRILERLVVPFLQLMALGAPFVIVVARLSRPWRSRKSFQESVKKSTDFWKHT